MREKIIFLLGDKKIRLLLLFLGGIFTGLTVAFAEIGFLQWLTLVPAAVAIFELADDRELRCRKLYGYGFFFFMCYYPVVYHWFINLYPLEFIEGMSPVAAVGIVLAGVFGISLIQALFGGLVFVVIGVVFRCRIAERAPIIKPFVAAGVWAVFEWTQTIGWIGVPWGRLAIGQTYHAIAFQTASLFGSYFISFLVVAVNFCIAFVILNITKGKVQKNALAIILASAMLVFQYGVGSILYFCNEAVGEEPLRVAAIQCNISSNEKWNTSSTSKTYSTYMKYSLEAAEQGADIILWPETAMPFSLEEKTYTRDFVAALAQKCGVPIIAGGFVDAVENEREGAEYNALVCFMPDGSVLDDIYAKRHLVPFGEYVPFEALIRVVFPPLAELVMGDMILVQGEGAQLMEVKEINVGALICFDSIYEALALESVREGAEVLFVSTNDSWFTDSAALYMHNAQAKLRAVECGRYVVRAANTGISSIINSRGEVEEFLGALETGIIIGEVYSQTSATLYSVIGNFFIYMCIIGNVALMISDKVNMLWQNKSKKY